MMRSIIFPGKYIQGADAIKRLGSELSRLGKSAFIICDPFVQENLLPRFIDHIRNDIDARTAVFGGECTDGEIERLASAAESEPGTVVAGLGGGKTLDTAKAVAEKLGVPVAIVPTAASTDAPCSALAVIYSEKGVFERYLWLRKNPDLVLVDTKIAAQAPIRLLVAGMGDALATWFEADSVFRNHAQNLTGDLGLRSAHALAGLCYDTLLNKGIQARIASETNSVTPALEQIVEANTLLSGVGFESGGLAAAHAIHNGLSVNPDTHTAYHGEKVAFGTLASLFLTDKSREEIDTVYEFCEAVGLPTIFSAIGLVNPDDAALMDIADAACVETETIHNERGEVSPENVAAALKTANTYGEARKKQGLFMRT